MKKIIIFVMIVLFPIGVVAYSDHVILGGNTVGIEVKSDGVLIVGFYKVNGKYNKGKPELFLGDYIISINDNDINTVTDLTTAIEKYSKKGSVDVVYRRAQSEYKTVLNIVESDGLYKTGIYVKDNITGIGTLTYIDPETKIYGALGHEIIENNSQVLINVSDGLIFKNEITSIDKSSIGNPGSKNAKFYYDIQYGNVFENTKYGIYGKYNDNFPNNELIEVANPNEVKIGPAVIYTVINGQTIEQFDVEITKINENSDIKNMTIEITDSKLIDVTGGVVQGMSGSPIVQNNKIIGAVTHVIVDNPVTGYGLFITTMLEEGEN